MSSILESVEQRTNLAGQNRMELLMFRLTGQQLFGINVFKVREVIPKPGLARLPHAHPAVRGIARIRGKTMPVVDLAAATGGQPMPPDEPSLVIVTEYNRTTQGFLVPSVDRIVNLSWEAILPPPSGAAGSAYLTGVTRVDEQLVQILDVEKVLAEVNAMNPESETQPALPTPESAGGYQVLVVDDSAVARRQVCDTLQRMGFQVVLAGNGEEALQRLQSWGDGQEEQGLESLLMVISDIEMPRMDGYTLTARIRADERLRHLHVLLHTSLSGVFNSGMAEQVGADGFIAKFAADELGRKVVEHMDRVEAA